MPFDAEKRAHHRLQADTSTERIGSRGTEVCPTASDVRVVGTY
jgi:hypothetical protein